MSRQLFVCAALGLGCAAGGWLFGHHTAGQRANVEMLQRRVLNDARQQLMLRVEQLANKGTLPGQLAQKLLRDAETVPLALTETADLAPNTVLARIEAYEELAQEQPPRPASQQGAEAAPVAPGPGPAPPEQKK